MVHGHDAVERDHRPGRERKPSARCSSLNPSQIYQDRALEFYVDKLGFEKRRDIPVGAGRADHADLQTRGVDVDPEVLRIPGAPPMFGLRDPDGNSLILVDWT
jgi:hypothetical protein